MVATTAIADTDEKTSLLKLLLMAILAPLSFIRRLLQNRNKKIKDGYSASTATTKDHTTSVNHDESLIDQKVWPELRLSICERLWGDGCLNPFTAEYVNGALRLLDVDESKSLLQLGSGLGGTTRSMVEQLGVWVTGYEVSEDLLEIAKKRNQMAGLTKKAAISRLRPEAPKFKENGFNAALIYECMTSIEDKEMIIKGIAASLRENGHFIMADFVLPSSDPPNELVKKWYGYEPEKPKLWTARRTYDAIKNAGLEVRIAEDFTADYRSMVLTGWLKLLSGLSKKELTPDFSHALIKECEYWIFRVAALDSGGLKVYRYHAIKQ